MNGIIVGIDRGDRVRLGFDFPWNIQVHRLEIADRIRSKILDGGKISLDKRRGSCR